MVSFHRILGRLQIDLVSGMMDCLYAECKPCITACVMAELEKLGTHYRVALKVAKVSLHGTAQQSTAYLTTTTSSTHKVTKVRS